MAAPFAGLFTGKNTQAPPAAPSSPKGAFSGLFSSPTTPNPAPVAPVQPVSPISGPSTSPAPVSTPSGIPASALKGNLGGGYGAAVDTDPASGKPLLTYLNQDAKASQLLSDRTAPTFDPTKPQKINPKTLQDPRMAQSVSDGIRKAVGATAFQELDHIMPLELGGSNVKANLRLEPGKNPAQKYSGSNPTPTDSIENDLADQAHNGDKTGVSLVDAWRAMAKAKGITLPEDGGAVPNMGQKGIQKNTQANEQPKNIPGMVALKAFPALTSSLADLQTNPLSLGHSVKEILATPFDDHQKAGEALGAAIANFNIGLKNNVSASEKISDALQVAATGAGYGLSTITGLFDAASKIPILGSALKLAINIPFSLAGDVAGDMGMGILNQLPIPQEAKDNLEPGVRAIYALAGQFGIGAHIAPDVLKSLHDTFGPKDTNTIIEKAKELAQEKAQGTVKPPQTPAEAQPAALAPIQPAPTVEPTKPTEAPAAAPASPEPKTSELPAPPATETPAAPTRLPNGALRPIEGTGDLKTRGLSEGVEAKAISSKLTEAFGDLPEYKTMDVADQGARAIDLFQKDPEAAKQIAYGAKAPPKGLTPEAVFIAVEQDAIERGDAETLQKLANSRLTTEATTMGQRLRMLAERDPENPTEAIKAVQAARERAIEIKNQNKNVNVVRDRVTNDITREIKRASSRPRDWSSFVESITC